MGNASNGIEFFPLPGFNTYVISRCGIVKRLPRKTSAGSQIRKDRKKILSGHTCIQRLRAGYPSVQLRVDGKGVNYVVHRLLAITFIPNPEGKPCINHINGIKTDNRLENLEWVTHHENNVHAVQTGLMHSGSRHRWAKLNESDVREIIEMSRCGVPGRQIAAAFGVYKNTIYHILKGRNWKQLQAA